MPARVRVFAGVPVRRAVATERDATRLARAQVNPARPDLHAFFAFTALRMFDVNDCVEMRTASVGHDKLNLFHDKKARNIRPEAWKPSVFRTDCR
jgi:hypothetical protein